MIRIVLSKEDILVAIEDCFEKDGRERLLCLYSVAKMIEKAVLNTLEYP